MQAVAAPAAARVEFADLGRALALGWRDFCAAPQFGILFGAIYVACGLSIWAVLRLWNIPWAILPLAVGFPLIGPFVAVGLYEVSRRLSRGERPRWGPVLAVVLGERNRQIPWMSAVIVGVFLAWLFIADVIFALFLGLGPHMRGQTLQDVLASPDGLAMLAVGSLVGAAIALVLYAITVVSLPLLLDREVDFVTAMLVSIRVVRMNPAPMLAWAALIAVLMFLALLPAFLGLMVVLPVLGHASWHLYARAVAPEAGR
ncbi:MAG: membrane protein [Paracoccaceae bacterium]|nr:MAG: membrane protein [Paracoccaceae bacterium]